MVWLSYPFFNYFRSFYRTCTRLYCIYDSQCHCNTIRTSLSFKAIVQFSHLRIDRIEEHCASFVEVQGTNRPLTSRATTVSHHSYVQIGILDKGHHSCITKLIFSEQRKNQFPVCEREWLRIKSITGWTLDTGQNNRHNLSK